ncbi:hypothetical protein TNCV_414381 [Trichonephila clavipes]|nr:hypothetical protein TNCV_414381 [Trichonephila clavipes]
MTTEEERIPIVHSFTVWKMCKALDLKAKFVPLPGTTALPRTPHRGADQMTTAPVYRAKIALSPAWCSRPTTGVPLAHATMNFVALDVTTSDRISKVPSYQEDFDTLRMDLNHATINRSNTGQRRPKTGRYWKLYPMESRIP